MKTNNERDPSRPLRPTEREQFAQAVFAGMSQHNAYIKVYPHAGKWKKANAVDSKASQLAAKVRQRIEYLHSQTANAKILTKEQLAEGYSRMFQTTVADFIDVDEHGSQFVKVTKASMAALALKKVKVKQITNSDGETMGGIYLTEIELESKVAAGQALSKLMGYDPRNTVDIHADQETRDFLQSILGRGVTDDDDDQNGDKGE